MTAMYVYTYIFPYDRNIHVEIERCVAYHSEVTDYF